MKDRVMRGIDHVSSIDVGNAYKSPRIVALQAVQLMRGRVAAAQFVRVHIVAVRFASGHMVLGYEQRIEVRLCAHDRVSEFENVVVAEMVLYSFAYQMDRVVVQLVQLVRAGQMPNDRVGQIGPVVRSVAL